MGKVKKANELNLAPAVEAVPESPLRELLRLTNELRASHGQEAVNQALLPFSYGVTNPTGPVVASKEPVKTLEEPEMNQGAMRFGIGIAAIFTLAVIGWGGRDALFGRSEASTNYRPATLAEAHKFLAKNGVGDSADPPKKKSGPAPSDPISDPDPLVDGPTKTAGSAGTPAPIDEEKNSSKLGRTSFEGPDLQAMPAPLPGPIVGSLPPANGMEAIPESGAPVAHSSVDLHGLEAKVRTAVSSAGGKVVRVHESNNDDGSMTKTLTVSSPSGMANAVASRVRSIGGAHAMVSDPEEEEVSPDSESDPVKASELKAAMDTVTSTKAQLVKAEIDFLPGAPAIRSMEAQYSEAQKNLAELKKSKHSGSKFTVVLTTG